MYERLCPNCNNKLKYSTKYVMLNANKKNSICHSCVNLTRKHSVETRLKISNSHKKYWTEELKKEKSIEMIEVMKSKKIRKKISNYMKTRIGEKNFFYGKHHTEESKKKMGRYMGGKNNTMYGKPSPQGSGNGWSGWYKGWYFRSIKELSYMINVIERFNMEWKSAETKEFKIPYINWEGTERNYFPDFLIENKYIIEIKPKKLWNSPAVKSKKEAAEKWCEERNYIYKLIETKTLKTSEIKKLHDSKKIKFIKRYEEKFVKYNT